MFGLSRKTLREELTELRDLQNRCFGKGVYATHLLIHDSKRNGDGVAFFTRVEGDHEDTFYMMRGFHNKSAVTYDYIKRNSRDGTLVPLGDSGIKINQDNYFRISNGEVYLCGEKGCQERVEDLVRE